MHALAAAHEVDAAGEERLGRLLTHLSRDERVPSTVRGEREVLERHLSDSLVALELSALRAPRRAVDLGSGAGLPGLALAIARPATEFALVESRREKCAYIAGLVAALELDNVRVECRRIEDWPAGLGAYDLALARALAAQPVVLEYAAPLLATGGQLVEWRGARDEGEEAQGDRAAAQLGLRRVAVLDVQPYAQSRDRHLHVFEKVHDTPPEFPRRAGVAQRRPLG